MEYEFKKPAPVGYLEDTYPHIVFPEAYVTRTLLWGGVGVETCHVICMDKLSPMSLNDSSA